MDTQRFGPRAKLQGRLLGSSGASSVEGPATGEHRQRHSPSGTTRADSRFLPDFVLCPRAYRESLTTPSVRAGGRPLLFGLRRRKPSFPAHARPSPGGHVTFFELVRS